MFILTFFILHGYVQEWIFTHEKFRHMGLFFSGLQFTLYTCFASIERFIYFKVYPKLHLTKDEDDERSSRTYLALAFLSVLTTGCSNTSFQFLNYPTQVIFKCCKMIPVLLLGFIIQKKKYNLTEIFAAIVLYLGLTNFILADITVMPNFDYRGIILITISLISEACMENMQEHCMRNLGYSKLDLIFYSYLYGALLINYSLLLKGELLEYLNTCLEYPFVFAQLLVYALTGYLGIQFVMEMIRNFGAFATVIVTTCRKVITICLSFLLFSKPFTMKYVWSGLVVVLGIGLNIYAKRDSRNEEMKRSLTRNTL